MTLRAGEAHGARPSGVVSGGQSHVTYGRRPAGAGWLLPKFGSSLTPKRIDETPRCSAGITACRPLESAAFRPAKGTGDLFINAGGLCHAGGRRPDDSSLTGRRPTSRADDVLDAPDGGGAGDDVLSSAFSAEFGWTSSTAVNVTKSGTSLTHGRAVPRPTGAQPTTLPADNQCPPSVATAPRLVEERPRRSSRRHPHCARAGVVALGGAIVQNKTHSPRARQNRTAAITTPLSPSRTSSHYDQVVDAVWD